MKSKFLPSAASCAPVVVPQLSRAKCEHLIQMFCDGGEFDLAEKLATYADNLPR